MNTEHESLARALSDLAGEMPDNHRRVTQVHDRVRRTRRHRRVAGGAAISVAALGAVGAGVLRPGASTPQPSLTTPVSSLPACSSVPPRTTVRPPTKTPAPSAEYVKHTGLVTAIPNADSVVVTIDDPTDATGSSITLVTDASTKVLASSNKDAGHDALQVGQHVGFVAHMSDTGATVADFINLDTPVPSPAVEAGPAKAPAVEPKSQLPTNLVKGLGTIQSASASSLTVALEGSSWNASGSVKVNLDDATEYYVGGTACAAPQFQVGQRVAFAAERQADGSYRGLAVLFE